MEVTDEIRDEKDTLENSDDLFTSYRTGKRYRKKLKHQGANLPPNSRRKKTLSGSAYSSPIGVWEFPPCLSIQAREIQSTNAPFLT
jgi:hypothetical protein